MNNRKIRIGTSQKQLQINVFVCGGGAKIKPSPKYVKKILILT